MTTNVTTLRYRCEPHNTTTADRCSTCHMRGPGDGDTLYAYVCVCMAVHGCAWLCMAVHGCAWLCMAVHGCACLGAGLCVSVSPYQYVSPCPSLFLRQRQCVCLGPSLHSFFYDQVFMYIYIYIYIYIYVYALVYVHM
jgi:hypothetical protein